MDTKKSRKFYQERYNKAIEQFGENSLTAKICKKKLEFLDTMANERDNANDTEDKISEDKTDTKSNSKSDELS